MWINRYISDHLNRSVTSRPAVLLTGARQTGKSSLLQKEYPDLQYVTFDHVRHVDAVKESPEHYLSRFDNPVILDEIQYVPEIFRELKIRIDRQRQRYGQWIMTGSQQFVMMKEISESLAGRMALLHLETLSAGELRDGHADNPADFLWKGGYPELWANPLLDPSDFFESYIRTYIERDLKEIVDVKNLSDFRRFIRITATRTGQLLNYRSLANDVGVSDVTIRSWIHALEISGLIYLLPPYFANVGKRLIKSPKLYFADHGLLCYLLGVTCEDDWHAHPQKGSLWENAVMMEFVKTRGLVPGRDLFFYRDQNGVEIDLVVEKPGKLILVEAKAGERIDPKKLHFKRVQPLFNESWEVVSILAHPTPDKSVLSLNGYMSVNPLLTALPFDA